MNDIITKDFHGLKILLIIIDGKEWFFAKDIAEILGYLKTRNAIAQHCKNAINFSEILNRPNLGQLDLQPFLGNAWKQIKIIPESDVWRLVVKSTLPEAQKVEKWIFEDVLPQIRKTGSYSIQPTQKPKTQISEYQETLEYIDIFEKFSEKIKGKSHIELLKLDSFLTKSGKKSILDILNLDLTNLYFSVSELGEFSGQKGSEINQSLVRIGFQISENGVWKVLEKGKKFCFETQNSFSQLKWKPSILNKI